MADVSSQSALRQQARGLRALARHVAALKSVPRTGWLDRGIDPLQVESVADHSFGVALLAWTSAIERHAAGARLDPQRVLILALLHDLAEAATGDTPPYDPALVPGQDDPTARRQFLEGRHVRDEGRSATKRAAEDAAMTDLLSMLPDAARGEIAALWAELQEGASEEARFVKQADRLETFLQSRHYQNGDPDLPVASFHREVAETITDPLLAAIRDSALDDDPRDR